MCRSTVVEAVRRVRARKEPGAGVGRILDPDARAIPTSGVECRPEEAEEGAEKAVMVVEILPPRLSAHAFRECVGRQPPKVVVVAHLRVEEA